jgi:Fur family transcriptional regulator, zinc uptake regulator
MRRSPAQIEALVLDMLARAQRPLSAHGLANRVTAAGHRIVPNQIYRTLARLTAHGQVRRLESKACYMLAQAATDASLICQNCHTVHSIPATDLVEDLTLLARQCGFTPRAVILETCGRCAQCRAGGTPDML